MVTGNVRLFSRLKSWSALSVSEDIQVRRSNNRRKRQERQEVEHDEVISLSAAELENWQQKVINHVEDHFTNEQLKRIAEFGRVHGTVVQEAKQYVSNLEMQLRHQFELERASLRAEAEDYVKKTAEENKLLLQQLQHLKQQAEKLQKQVDRLEQEVEELKTEKAQSSQLCRNNRQGHFGNDQLYHFSPDIEFQEQLPDSETKYAERQDHEPNGGAGNSQSHRESEQSASERFNIRIVENASKSVS